LVASKYGATREIGETITDELAQAGHDAKLEDVEEFEGFDGGGTIVLGSAVYAGHWLKPAQAVLRDSAEVLATRQVWLFSSGPVGDPPKSEGGEPEGIDEALGAIGARGHELSSPGSSTTTPLAGWRGCWPRRSMPPEGTSGTGRRSGSGALIARELAAEQ
jgi:Flavodoxin domain